MWPPRWRDAWNGAELGPSAVPANELAEDKEEMYNMMSYEITSAAMYGKAWHNNKHSEQIYDSLTLLMS